MRGAVGSSIPPYEVRCPRCKVSFPVETRRCIHCGGATSAAPSTVGAGVSAGPIDLGGAEGRASGPFGGATGAAGSPTASPPFPPEEIDAAEGEAAGPVSWGASLLRSFGSLIWIGALVAFSMIRNCQGEG